MSRGPACWPGGKRSAVRLSGLGLPSACIPPGGAGRGRGAGQALARPPRPGSGETVCRSNRALGPGSAASPPPPERQGLFPALAGRRAGAAGRTRSGVGPGGLPGVPLRPAHAWPRPPVSPRRSGQQLEGSGPRHLCGHLCSPRAAARPVPSLHSLQPCRFTAPGCPASCAVRVGVATSRLFTCWVTLLPPHVPFRSPETSS